MQLEKKSIKKMIKKNKKKLQWKIKKQIWHIKRSEENNIKNNFNFMNYLE
jgi:hypothetical protein